MKKITFLIVIIAALFSANSSFAQVNQDANWPNAAWEAVMSGSTTAIGLVKDPQVDTNFSFNDNLAGSGSTSDLVRAKSPEIDLTPADDVTPIPHGQVVVTVDYVYNDFGSDVLKLQWYDNDLPGWRFWEDISPNSSNGDFQSCIGMTTYTSVPLVITAFTPSQKQHFKYRFSFDDDGWGYGFCFASPNLSSIETPLCMAVSSINADESDITDIDAIIQWTDNNGIAPADGWEVEYGAPGYSPGFGTSSFTLSNPYTITGLSASTCYDVYVKARCDDSEGLNSEWAGPFNFCTPITIAGCGDMFYDIGGPTSDYIAGLDEVTTMCPDVAGEVVTVIFDEFDTEGPDFFTDGDILSIFDGNSVSGTLIGEFTGTTLPPMITAEVVNGGCLTFRFISDNAGQRPGWAAQILCSPPITCFMAEDLGVNEATIGIHTAELFWTDTNTDAGEPTSGWDVEYGYDGFTPGTGTLVNTPTNPFTLTGLEDATDYCYYVKAACGTISGEEDSFWEGPFCFTTLCDVFPAPFIENFDGGLPNCWLQGVDNDEDWLFDNDYSVPGHLGNEGGVSGTTTLSGGGFAWVDDTSPNSLNTTLTSPFINLSGITNPVLGFYFISSDEFTNKNVSFSIDIWDGTIWHEDVYTHSGNSAGEGWEQKFVDLAAFNGLTVQAKFIIDENNTGVLDDFAIDDVYFGEMPDCVNVNSVSVDIVNSDSITLTWNDGNTIPGPATDWQVIHGAPGFDPDTTGTPVDTTINSAYVYGGLNQSTSYDVYIRANCTGGDSLWVGPISFTTLCTPFIAPYMEDFEDGGFLDACWTQSVGVDSWRFANNIAIPGHVGNAGSSGGTTTNSAGYFAWVDDDAPHALKNSITSPMIDASALATPTLYFYYISHNEGTSNVDFSVDVWDGTGWNLDFFTNDSNTNGWEEAMLDLTDLGPFTNGPIQFKFTVDEYNGTDFSDDFAIDDMRVDEEPDCWPIFDLVVSNETTSSVDLAWTDDDNDAISYRIEYGPLGFTSGSAEGTFTTTDNPFTATGLTSDTDYHFYVFALCPDGESELGPIVGTTLPTCFEVTGVSISGETENSAIINWTDVNPISPPVGGWDIKITYETDNFEVVMVPGLIETVTLPSSTVFPYTLGGLITGSTQNRFVENSTYRLFIRANCAAGDADSSRWSGPFILNTTGAASGTVSNDTAATAIELDVNLDCNPVNGGPTIGNNLQSNETAPNLATTCTDPATDGVDNAFDRFDVWYKFTMPAGVTTVLINTAFAGGMEDSAVMVYKEDGGSLVPAISYLPNGDVNNAMNLCNDDSDWDIGLASDNNNFSIVVLQNVTPEEEYFVRVWSVDRTNVSEGNIRGQFSICVRGGTSTTRFANTLETEETIIEDAISLEYFPNPVTNNLQLTANATIKAVSIYSVLGQQVEKIVLDKANRQTNVNMQNLKPGTYFVKVLLNNDMMKTIKIIKK